MPPNNDNNTTQSSTATAQHPNETTGVYESREGRTGPMSMQDQSGDTLGKGKYVELGYMRTDIPPEYKVVIAIRRPESYTDIAAGKKKTKAQNRFVIIKVPIQEKITTGTQADWKHLSAAYAFGSFISEVSQAGLGYAAVNRFVSRRMWAGTTPLEFTLNMKFVAWKNPKVEVLWPCMELQKLALPYTGDHRLHEFLLIPPGPNPFAIKWLNWAGVVIPGISRIGEDINISIGKYLKIKQCVVKNINVSYENKCNDEGIPMEATASVTFQTFEIQTKNSLEENVYRFPVKTSIPTRENKAKNFGHLGYTLGGL
jgi:hypothetical protein